MTTMLRSTLIYFSKASWAREMVTQWEFARRAASRFIAGEKLDDAIRVVRQLNQKGINATLDHLGEHTTTPEKAVEATRDILKILDAINDAGVRSNVSIKLSQIGMALNGDLCRDNFKRILDKSKAQGTFVRIDMEDSPWVDTTLELYQMGLEECGCENVGVVIQSYLFRSQTDIARIMAYRGRVRLCKGAYTEPADIAFPKKRDVDSNYDKIAGMLIDGAISAECPMVSENGKIPPIPAFATHDEQRIAFAKNYAEKARLPKQAMEFQMLYGIRRELQENLAAEGYPVRVYVPYGSEWYPYYTRRLAERPANVWFFVSNFFRR
jgi:proline dehydrogenase